MSNENPGVSPVSIVPPALNRTGNFPIFQRFVVWFSCGAASAVTAKLATCYVPKDKLEVVYCDTSQDEHPDNARFLKDVEKWINHPIKTIRSEKYANCIEVFKGEQYISGPRGARCTTELKKLPRLAFQWPDDVHFFGFTSDEKDRIETFEKANPELFLCWILSDLGISKEACFEMLKSAGIALPVLYLQGFPNNNCLGCVKVTSPGYWNNIKLHYPARFEALAKVSRDLGVRLVELKGVRIFLDELPPDAMGRWKHIKISCGPECGGAK